MQISTQQTHETSATEEQELEQKEFSFNQFTDFKKIGSGKFGKVYQARDKETKTMVALKVVYKKLLDQYNFYSQMKKELEI